MSAPRITRSREGGFEAVGVESGPLSLTLLPELGGKLASLRDTRSGREWLWRHPRLPYRRVPPESSYTALADTGGWDECFPTVDRCAYPEPPWQGAALPDHGELWSQPAELDVASAGEQLTLQTVWHGHALPYRFGRRVTVRWGSAVLRLDYSVDNLGAAPLRHAWCAHPLIAIEPGMRLSVPEGALFHVAASMPRGMLERGELLTFPFELASPGGSYRLDALPPREAAVALKVWSDPLDDAWAALAAPDGALRMRWGGGDWAQLALWLNLGAAGFDGGEPYYNLGLEPCIGAQENLGAALRDGLPVAAVPPGGSQTWWIEVELAQ